MHRRSYALAALCVAILLAVPAVSATPPVRPIAERSFVRIGGIEQWITIRGANRDNPVVLFLHGGPGDAWSPFADSLFRGWERDFTLVQWDQRGAGRTYSRNSEASVAPTMTFERMVQDGIEIAVFLTKHLHKPKIVIVGGSWGTEVGIAMAHAQPDLFYAYVGEAQLVGWGKNVRASYDRVLQLARAAGDEQAVAGLTAIGPPPWDALPTWPKFRKWERAYQSKVATAPEPDVQRDADYGSDAEREQNAAADDFSFLHFVGMTMSGPETHIDLPALGTEFRIPIFMIQGEQDLVAIPEVARAYFDTIKAPRKEFYLVPGTGHEMSLASLALLRRVLLEEIKPLTIH